MINCCPTDRALILNICNIIRVTLCKLMIPLLNFLMYKKNKFILCTKLNFIKYLTKILHNNHKKSTGKCKRTPAKTGIILLLAFYKFYNQRIRTQILENWCACSNPKTQFSFYCIHHRCMLYTQVH